MAVRSINYLTLAQIIHSQPRKKAIMELTAFCKNVTEESKTSGRVKSGKKREQVQGIACETEDTGSAQTL